MKTKLFFGLLILVSFITSSCDKVENIYSPAVITALDTTLYDGTWSEYLENEWPDFATLTASSMRNAIIEDYTGHNCSNCPSAASIAHALHEANPERVFIASVHSGPLGMSNFQQVTSQYNVDFTNSNSLELGTFFGNLPGSGFLGNPSGTANRLIASTIFYPSAGWGPKSSEVLASTLKVAIKSKLNYFASTKGAFIHTEVELLDASISNELAMTVYLLQDSMVAPQNVSSIFTPNYVHRDIHRKNISGQTFGRTLNASVLNENGRYYLDYSFVVPNQLAPAGGSGTFDASNMHVLIYVFDKVTYEIYQVVKEKFI